MSAKMTENNVENTDPGVGTLCEGPRSGRCSVAQQRRPGRYPTTAKKKWTKELNTAVMECYFLSDPVNEDGKPIRGYRQRMHRVWKDRGLLDVSEQNLCDQARAIRKNQWLSEVEIEMIKRYVCEKEDEVEIVGCGNDIEQELLSSNVTQSTVADDVGAPSAINIQHNSMRTEEERKILDEILVILNAKDKSFFPGLKKVDRKRLEDVTKSVNEIVGDIITKSITETNDLIYAASVYIAKRVGLRKATNDKNTPKEPWWRRRIQQSINEIRKHISTLERKRKGERITEAKYADIERKYRVKAKGANVVIEELKQRLLAKSHKLKRYNERIQQFKLNRMFDQDQKRVYQKLNGNKRCENSIPNAEESEIFWSNIWSQEKLHESEAEWLKSLKGKKNDAHQEDLIISEDLVRRQSSWLPNWKATGPDGVQGYWLKYLTSLHKRIALQLNEMINDIKPIPNWMTKGRTVLCQKDQAKGNEAGNFRPISCLPLMWKLMTGIISDNIYIYLESNELLHDEQKGCRRKSRGTKDQLIIDRVILTDCKRRQKNLAMAWVDYKKAYDMVPHSWIIECLKLVNISENVVNFINKSMPKWKTVLTACGETLCEVDIRRGIFQGDSLSPLLFVICMMPISSVLKKMRTGYTLGTRKINNLLFMDDIKLFAKSEKEIDSLVATVNAISNDIGMEFGIQKCGVLVLKRGKVVTSGGIRLTDSEIIREVDENGYKYLGIIESDKIEGKIMKESFRKEYFRRTRLVLQSKLHGRNKVKAINTWAVSLMRYGAGIIDWTMNELQEIDRRTRKLMTMNKALNPNSDKDRLYVKRKDGGRGLISIEMCIKTEENNLAWYVKNSNEEMLDIVKIHGKMKVEEAIKPHQFKRLNENRLLSEWRDKRMHGQFIREKDDVDWNMSWKWMQKGDLKVTTEALICSAQEQSIRTNYIKFYIDKSVITPMCRMCGEKGETVSHIVSECGKLAQREYKRRHDNVARYVHWNLCGFGCLDRADAWYKQEPDGVCENNEYKILWDMNIQCDVVIGARRPDIIFVDKNKKEAKIIDIAVPGDSRVKNKEEEKIEKYQPLKDELSRVWKLKKIMVIPVVVGALGSVSKNSTKHLEKLGKNVKTEVIQKTVLLGTARILRKVLSM